MKIKWLNTQASNQIYLSNSFLPMFEKTPFQLTLHFGNWNKKVNVLFDSNLPDGTFGLPEILQKEVIIPDQFSYNVKVDGSNLFVGPIIALILTPTTTGLKKRFKKYTQYIKYYKDIGGLIYICAGDGINIVDKTINGFYYDPNKRAWIEHRFPYPHAIYRRVRLKKKVYRSLRRTIGNHIFNSRFYNKWTLSKKLNQFEEVSEHLPDTQKLAGKESLEAMLAKHKTVYLKPMRGLKAKGIIKVEKVGQHFVFSHINKEKEMVSEEEANGYLSSKSNYIIQKEIKSDIRQNRNIVFRIILQKDQKKEWKCSGVYVRQGRPNSIATNRLLTDQFITGYEAFTKLYDLNKDEAIKKEEELVSTCLQTCHALDQLGNFGDIAIDAMIDHKLNIWLLEVNHCCHNHQSPLQTIQDRSMYETVIRRPLEYAKALSGF